MCGECPTARRVAERHLLSERGLRGRVAVPAIETIVRLRWLRLRKRAAGMASPGPLLASVRPQETAACLRRTCCCWCGGGTRDLLTRTWLQVRDLLTGTPSNLSRSTRVACVERRGLFLCRRPSAESRRCGGDLLSEGESLLASPSRPVVWTASRGICLQTPEVPTSCLCRDCPLFFEGMSSRPERDLLADARSGKAHRWTEGTGVCAVGAKDLLDRSDRPVRPRGPAYGNTEASSRRWLPCRRPESRQTPRQVGEDGGASERRQP